MMNAPKQNPNDPYPSVRGALVLTLLAMLASGFTLIVFIDFGLLAAAGIGQAIGVGAIATLGAKRVAEPQARRLGLRGIDLESIPLILCLIPAILLASELDNFAADFSDSNSEIVTTGASEGERADSSADAFEGESTSYDNEVADLYDIDGGNSPDALSENLDSANGGNEEADSTTDAADEPMRLVDPDDPASVLQAFVVMVGISPIVEEFLFRGVIQQGIVQRLGLIRGVSVVALLWSLLRPAPIVGFSQFLAAVIASFALGWALGIVRIATGSILGPILLASGWAAIGLISLVSEGRTDLPGMNVPGTHLPIMVTLLSAVIVAWAGRTIFQEAKRRFGEEDSGSGANVEPVEPS